MVMCNSFDTHTTAFPCQKVALAALCMPGMRRQPESWTAMVHAEGVAMARERVFNRPGSWLHRRPGALCP